MTLPQDIIINMRFNGFKQKYSNYFKKIIEFYGKAEHSNFTSFLCKINNYHNIVYTFSNTLENIKNINVPFIGEIINDENIKKININSINSENELETQLEDLFNNNKYKICIIKFMPNEANYMNYLSFFINNKEKEYNDKKIFIFIVYIVRVLNRDLDKLDKLSLNKQKTIKSKILEETLSNLSGYYQIFIDNLNGNDKFKIEEIINKNSGEIINKCINEDEQIYLSLFKSISYMNYNIIYPDNNINKDNYCNKLLLFISKNNNLKKNINDCITKEIFSKNEDIIKVLFKKENIIKETDIDISSIIEKYLVDLYNLKLNMLYFMAEKEQFFSSFLTIEEEKIEENLEEKNNNKNQEKPKIENIDKKYFENLFLEKDKIRLVEKPRANKIDIILGFKLPGIKPVLERIRNYVKDNIIKKYWLNDNNLRSYYEQEEIKNEIDKYFNVLKRLNDNTIHRMNNERLLMGIINENKEENKELFNLIMNDYYIIFIENNLKIGNQDIGKEKFIMENKKRFINYIIDLRNKIILPYLKDYISDKNILKVLAININWIESYKEEICSIIKMFLRLNNNENISNLLDLIKKIIDEKQIKFEISERNPKYFSIVNEIFFLSIDSIMRVITSKEELYNLSNEKLFGLINTDKEILQNALQLEANMNLRSKEIYSLQEILKLINAFYENKLASVENIKKIIHYFGEETICNNEKWQRKLTDNFIEFYKFLEEKLGKYKENKNFKYYKILSFMLLNEYIKITFKDFRKLLLEKVLENNELMLKSSKIFQLILENTIDFSPTEIINNLDLIKGEESPIFKKLNVTDSEFLDEVIMNIFERKFRVYFESIPKLDRSIKEELYPKYLKDNKYSNNKNDTGIVFDNSFEIFKQTIQFLDSISKENCSNNPKENQHLCKLYSIVFIKMYLSKLVFFIKEKYNQMGNIKDIINVFQEIENKNLAKVI